MVGVGGLSFCVKCAAVLGLCPTLLYRRGADIDRRRGGGAYTSPFLTLQTLPVTHSPQIPGVDDSSDDDCCSTCHGKDCCQKCDKCSQPPSRTGKHKFVALSKKEEKSHPLPEGGKVIAGSKGDAEWLYWHEVNEGLWCILDCHPFFLLDCPLSEDEVAPHPISATTLQTFAAAWT